MSISDYLLSEFRKMAERPTLDELRARLERHPEMTLKVTPAEAVRAERDIDGAVPDPSLVMLEVYHPITTVR